MIVFHTFAFMFDNFGNLFSLKREEESQGWFLIELCCPKFKKQWRCELRGASLKSCESPGLTVFWVVLSSEMCVLEWGQGLDSLLFTAFCL